MDAHPHGVECIVDRPFDIGEVRRYTRLLGMDYAQRLRLKRSSRELMPHVIVDLASDARAFGERGELNLIPLAIDEVAVFRTESQSAFLQVIAHMIVADALVLNLRGACREQHRRKREDKNKQNVLRTDRARAHVYEKRRNKRGAAADERPYVLARARARDVVERKGRERGKRCDKHGRHHIGTRCRFRSAARFRASRCLGKRAYRYRETERGDEACVDFEKRCSGKAARKHDRFVE